MCTVAEVVRAIINLVRPDWTRFRAIARIVVHAGGLAVGYFLFRAGTWVMAGDVSGDQAREMARAVEVINQVFHYALAGAVILSAAGLMFRIVELVQRWRWHGAPRAARPPG